MCSGCLELGRAGWYSGSVGPVKETRTRCPCGDTIPYLNFSSSSRNRRQALCSGADSASVGHGHFKPDHSSRGGKKAPKTHILLCQQLGFGLQGSAPAWPQAVRRERLLGPSLPLAPGDAFAYVLLKNVILSRYFDWILF